MIRLRAGISQKPEYRELKTRALAVGMTRALQSSHSRLEVTSQLIIIIFFQVFEQKPVKFLTPTFPQPFSIPHI